MNNAVNRFRWHHVLLATRRKFETAPGDQRESYAEPDWFRRVALDLRPRLNQPRQTAQGSPSDFGVRPRKYVTSGSGI